MRPVPPTGSPGRSRPGRLAYGRAPSRCRSSNRVPSLPGLHLIEDLGRHVVRAPPAFRYLVQPQRQQLLDARPFQEPAPHASFQDGPCPRRQALPPSLGQLAARLKIGVMAIESGRELVHSGTRRRHGREHRRLPVAGRFHRRPVRPVVRGDVTERVPPPDTEHHLDLLLELVGARTVALVHHVNVRDFHDPGLERLNPIARFGHEHEYGRLGRARDVELGLPDAHRLQQHALEAECLEQIGDFLRRRGESAVRAPRRHRADEHAGIDAGGFHPDPVAEQRPTGERAGRIHGHDADGEVTGAEPLNQRFRERALPRPRGAGDADPPRAAAPEQPVRMRQHPLEPVALVLDERDGAGQGRGLAPGEPLENLLRHHARLMRQIRSSARSSGTVRTGPGRTATRSTRVAVAARMSNSSPWSANRSPGLGIRPSACTSSPATVWTPRVASVTPSASSSRLAGALPSSSTIRTGGSSRGGEPPGSKISDTRSRSRSSNVTRPAVPPNSSSTTARWLRPRCISSMRSAARVVPGTTRAARAAVSAFASTAASVVRVEGSRHGTKGANARPSFSSRGAACATIGSAQRRPTTRGTRYAALTSNGMPSAMVKTPSTVGVVRARSAGIAAAAQMIPTVVRAFAVASTRPGFSSTPAAPPAPRSLYDTQRVSSSWLTAAAATPMAADAAARINPNSSSTAGSVTVASAAARWSRGVGLPAPRRPDSHRASARRRRGARAPAPSRRAHPPSRPPDARDRKSTRLNSSHGY